MNRFLFVAALLTAGGCLERHPDSGERTSPSSIERVSVMTYNVENLFDAEDDPGKDDRAFLPIGLKQNKEHVEACAQLRRERWREECLTLDWNEKVLGRKIRRIGEVILASEEGRGPDVLILEEVENKRVLERLRVFLSSAGYAPGVLIEGGDARGIDAAILSRLPQARVPVLHEIPGAPLTRRGVLEAAFRLPDNNVLTVFALHLPSPGSPRSEREAGLRRLNALLGSKGPTEMVVAGGDFNITSSEDAAFGLLDAHLSPNWIIAHRAGCAGCAGTAYYRATENWSFLDMILASKNLDSAGSAPWRLLENSVRVVSGAPGQKNRWGAPARFDPVFGTGASDHFPLQATLVKRKN